jgi:hypothetical protein
MIKEEVLPARRRSPASNRRTEACEGFLALTRGDRSCDSQSLFNFGRAGASVDERRVVDGRQVRFTCCLDDESARFEDELFARVRQTTSDEAHAGSGELVTLPLPQRHVWLRHTRREFRLLQVRDRDGKAAAQVVLSIYRPQSFVGVGNAVAHKLGPAATGADEEFALSVLRQLCAEQGDILTLRVQPRRFDIRDLRDFEARARRAGFELSEPESVTRTLLFDLTRTPDEIMAQFPKRTRAKVRHRKRSDVELRVLTDDVWIPRMRAAADASVSRTDRQARSRYEWEPMLAVARDRPDLSVVVGLFLNGRPDELLAFASAERHGALAEYTAAGSRTDPELRSLPFNYFLVWELISWARQHGSTALDLGGVTDGGQLDPLAGISEFKRHFTDAEGEVGRELSTALHPIKAGAYAAIRALRGRWRARAGENGDPHAER